jgi:hypothetical protein
MRRHSWLPLINLFEVGVFISFKLSQTGMVVTGGVCPLTLALIRLRYAVPGECSSVRSSARDD